MAALARLFALCALLPVALLSHGADGAALFRDNCAACHQANAGGAPGIAPPLLGTHWSALQDPQEHYILQVLAAGLTGKITVNGEPFNGVMPSFRHLDTDDIAAVANYLLVLQTAGQAAPVTARDVMAARDRNLKPAQVRALRHSLLKE